MKSWGCPALPSCDKIWALCFCAEVRSKHHCFGRSKTNRQEMKLVMAIITRVLYVWNKKGTFGSSCEAPQRELSLKNCQGPFYQTHGIKDTRNHAPQNPQSLRKTLALNYSGSACLSSMWITFRRQWIHRTVFKSNLLFLVKVRSVFIIKCHVWNKVAFSTWEGRGLTVLLHLKKLTLLLLSNVINRVTEQMKYKVSHNQLFLSVILT